MTGDTHLVKVARKSVEAVDIASFELVAMEGERLPAFAAGSHIDVHVPGGPVRQYSLCNDPAESHRYLIGVLRDAASRGGSSTMHDSVSEGDVLTVSSPKNHFSLAKAAQRSLLLAGGIGVTPILCMAERLAATGAAFTMHYCTRSRERTAFVDRISASSFASQVCFHHDDADPSQRLDLASLLATPVLGTHLYVCGPLGFMNAVLDAARSSGWAEEQLHYEFFAAAAVSSDADQNFEVQLASSGRVIPVKKEQSIVQALSAAGVEVPTSCEQGVCGTCLTRVLEGEPDHRDMYLTPEEQARNDQMLVCCSRASSARLVLDL
ncbi:PDR/VanB family oxidoreductase [Variovorax sp. J22P271]|uniref:PDR/VanB family oxidoreductase n=1 Tax=Variovorax davisae TaxID=3053515 RepID=UPI0025759368|nr:PDR/VanB family oxidoreductase [Variovorax sp. J22P271]MDM0032416.1 PDR/VanB family oxidoreductase [Variovorax sp. J22P271]